MMPMVFLHGWAQSRQVWFQQQGIEAAQFLNLPGHGGASDAPTDQWLDILAEQLPAHAVMVGWSLGGMLALELVRRYPDRVSGLVLVATTPRFRQGDGWLCGCDDALFSGFEAAVNSDSVRQLNRFFAMMLHADGLSRSDYNALARSAVDREHPPTRAALSSGLELLAGLDLREQAAAISVPTLLLHGEEDAVVSCDAGRWLADTIPRSQSHCFAGCGHAPFLTCPERFNQILVEWRRSL